MSRCGQILFVLALLLGIPIAAMAQTAEKPPAQSSQAQPASPAQPADQLLKPEQLEALVAPIALYPDELLANVLAASTYPLEVVQADRWLKERKNLKGDALKKEVDKQAWDDSIKALTSTADVLTMMSDKLEWIKSLGDAVLAQQPDVMDAIQRLRTKAYDNKKLVTTKQQKVSVQTQENKQVVVIEQAEPDTIYVPYYDPATVYGTWPYTEYPPYYFGYPSYIGAGVIAAGVAFGAGWAIGRWGNYWGGGCNWGNRNLYVNHYNRINNVGNNWQHNPAHRQGVRYNNTNVQQRFGNNNLKAGAADRMDFRGRDGQQVLKDRAGVADRAGDRGGDRAADRGGDRAGARDGSGSGDRANRSSTADRAKASGKGSPKGGGKAATKGGADRARAASNAGNAARRGGENRGGAINVSSGRAAAAASARGQASMGARGGGGASFAGRGGGGGGAMRGGGGFGGGGGRGGGGGGRRSDIALKHDIVLLGRLANGLGFYRFSYLGSQKTYVGVIAQEVEGVMPQAVTRGRDGYLRVYYERLGLKLRSYRDWLADGARIPAEMTP
ncbi:DUF3300 domain-containing protein [Bradyrhizobium quebecense]|uniref:DUF3300 domain-containing protein n=2 Tax=Bradyrhizobium quebecense TaxID=2748629 RepID=A0ABS3MEQ8_9BRAD|nr:DUF3300 domain-containing protein [Bradyrhizobium quebecense]UGY07027.1 DUF3300 domain-containing protein [Bradyrhizobium quebecense]